jgi:hypothetical protein
VSAAPSGAELALHISRLFTSGYGLSAASPPRTMFHAVNRLAKPSDGNIKAKALSNRCIPFFSWLKKLRDKLAVSLLKFRYKVG